MSIKGTPNTETMNDLAETYLDRLAKGECEPGDQPVAATILGEALRRARNTATAARETARILAHGIEEERKG